MYTAVQKAPLTVELLGMVMIVMMMMMMVKEGSGFI